MKTAYGVHFRGANRRQTRDRMNCKQITSVGLKISAAGHGSSLHIRWRSRGQRRVWTQPSGERRAERRSDSPRAEVSTARQGQPSSTSQLSKLRRESGASSRAGTMSAGQVNHSWQASGSLPLSPPFLRRAEIASKGSCVPTPKHHTPPQPVSRTFQLVLLVLLYCFCEDCLPA